MNSFMALPRRRQYVRRLAVASAALWLVCPAVAQTTLDRQEQRERAQREAEARSGQREAPDVRLGSSLPPVFRTGLPVEAHCVRIDTLRLEGAHADTFRFVQRYLDQYQGRCLGASGIQTIRARAAAILADAGYVTTRVALPEQAVGPGVLRFQLLPGTIGRIRAADSSWRTAFPLREGDVLNLRDIEQGLEQLKRLASQDANVDIAPGQQAGESDLVLTIQRGRPWHAVATLDDTGSRSTGRLQAGVNLSMDNLLRLNDLFSLGLNRNVPASAGHGTSGMSMSYSVPKGYWLFSVALYDYAYRQTITGYLQSFQSRGKSRTADLTIQRVVHRGSHGRSAIEFRVGKRWAHSFIEDVELITQRRHVTTAEVAFVQRQDLGHARLDLRLARRHGVSWLGGQRDAPGLAPNAPRFGYHLNILDASLTVPFRMGRLSAQWTSDLRAQRSAGTLYGSEFIAIGGRYTVRGFDGEQTLAGERGWYWRNTLTLPLGALPAAVYFGFDTGHIGGPSTPFDTPKSLSGSFVGVRASAGRFGLDAFAGWAWRGARALDSMRPATGFQLTYQL
ncbi:hemolysin activation/secretion protein [Luteibacter sp. Sphag1AF]|uniref:ShlB/FhaC/HecB family hemolysin secretion/activation protein n=1 Tax=Luteibacter sp. Sphag1AF TaxID=2587031 RepID=UPI0016165F98|nr:ShlB/FhaC/HecB family hemolysin secretion/activation protein [Luteibacter sp. Sphag1AF]MBB3225560.1 hemolysin activation/secretion protein [Luteibacter sp. Sphag1AF]